MPKPAGPAQSDDVVRIRHLEAMGDALGARYHELSTQLAWVHVRWLTHRQLFGTSRERFDLLNQVAPFFFHMLQQWLWEDLILDIARLIDSPTSGKKANLSLNGLPPLVSDPALRSDVEAALVVAGEECAFARDWRNRQLAHRDLQLVLSDDAQPLPPAEVAHVERALESLRQVLNLVAVGYDQPPEMYELVNFGDCDIENLVDCLGRGVRSPEV